MVPRIEENQAIMVVDGSFLLFYPNLLSLFYIQPFCGVSHATAGEVVIALLIIPFLLSGCHWMDGQWHPVEKYLQATALEHISIKIGLAGHERAALGKHK